MALQLTNNKSLTIAGTDIELINPLILCDKPNVHVIGQGVSKLICPYMVYQNGAAWVTDRIKNHVKTELLYKKYVTIIYNKSTDGDQWDYVDIKMKEDLVKNHGIAAEDIIFQPPHD